MPDSSEIRLAAGQRGRVQLKRRHRNHNSCRLSKRRHSSQTHLITPSSESLTKTDAAVAASSRPLRSLVAGFSLFSILCVVIRVLAGATAYFSTWRPAPVARGLGLQCWCWAGRFDDSERTKFRSLPPCAFEKKWRRPLKAGRGSLMKTLRGTKIQTRRAWPQRAGAAICPDGIMITIRTGCEWTIC